MDLGLQVLPRVFLLLISELEPRLNFKILAFMDLYPVIPKNVCSVGQYVQFRDKRQKAPAAHMWKELERDGWFLDGHYNQPQGHTAIAMHRSNTWEVKSQRKESYTLQPNYP